MGIVKHEEYQDKIKIVIDDILQRFPDCHYTVRLLLWDDETYSVECRHGDTDKIYISTYYNDELTYQEIDFKKIGNSMMIDDRGNEYYRKLN